LAIIILPTITGVCTPACLLAASISVEAVTPPLVGLATQRTDSRLGANPIQSQLFDVFRTGEGSLLSYKRGANQERIQEVKAALECSVSAVIPFHSRNGRGLEARIKGSLKIPSADAIHLACAATAGTDFFLTNDNNLVGKVVPGIQFIAGLDSNVL